MREIINKLNALYGDKEFSDDAQLGFAKGIKDIISQHSSIIDQVRANEWDVAVQGDILSSVTEAVLEQLDNVNGLGRVTLEDEDNIKSLAEIIYMLIRHESDAR